MKEKYEERQRAIKVGISPQVVKEEKPRTVDDGIMPPETKEEYLTVHQCD